MRARTHTHKLSPWVFHKIPTHTHAHTHTNYCIALDLDEIPTHTHTHTQIQERERERETQQSKAIMRSIEESINTETHRIITMKTNT